MGSFIRVEMRPKIKILNMIRVCSPHYFTVTFNGLQDNTRVSVFDKLTHHVFRVIQSTSYT